MISGTKVGGRVVRAEAGESGYHWQVPCAEKSALRAGGCRHYAGLQPSHLFLAHGFSFFAGWERQFQGVLITLFWDFLG